MLRTTLRFYNRSRFYLFLFTTAGRHRHADEISREFVEVNIENEKLS